jgi:methyl-accepting chemotaxis protein
VATEEISHLTGTSVQIAEQAGVMLDKLVPDIQKTADLVKEISSASKEQATGADQINTAIQRLNQVVQQNAAAAEEIASTAEELTTQADQLQTTIAFFKMEAGARRREVSERVAEEPKKFERKAEIRIEKRVEKKSEMKEKRVQPLHRVTKPKAAPSVKAVPVPEPTLKRQRPTTPKAKLSREIKDEDFTRF